MPNVQYIIRIATTCTLLSCFVRFCNLRVAYHPPQKTSPSAAAFAHLWRTCQIAKFRRVMSCNSYQTYEILPHSISEGEFDIKFRRKIIMLLLLVATFPALPDAHKLVVIECKLDFPTTLFSMWPSFIIGRWHVRRLLLDLESVPKPFMNIIASCPLGWQLSQY